ncbi:MAG: Os1348 family NHLP clan protein [Candidatus Limnocylindria bacterium]
MTSSTLRDIVHRAISDTAFRARLREDPQGALRGLDLGPREASAIASADRTPRGALEVEARASRLFSLGLPGSDVSRIREADVASGNAFRPDEAGTGGVVGGDAYLTADEAGRDGLGLRGAVEETWTITGSESTIDV